MTVFCHRSYKTDSVGVTPFEKYYFVASIH